MPDTNVADDAWRCESCSASCDDAESACSKQAVALSQLPTFLEVAIIECRLCWYSGRRHAVNGSALRPSHTHWARVHED